MNQEISAKLVGPHIFLEITPSIYTTTSGNRMSIVLTRQEFELLRKAVVDLELGVLCPRCKDKSYLPMDKGYLEEGKLSYPALSRRDNKTYICSDCGVRESLEDARIAGPYEGPTYWEE